MGKCFYCGASLKGNQYRSSVCPACGKDSKICLNCDFYSKDSHWDCRESIGEVVIDKERSNFCDFFKLSNKSHPKKDNNKSAVEAFNKLFGD